MGYLTGETLIYLISAALIGAVVGWLLRGVFCRAREKKLVGELKETHAKLDTAEGNVRRQSASYKDLRSEFETQARELEEMSDELSTARASLDKRKETIAQLESDLVQLRDEKEVELANLREHVNALESLQGQLDESQTERNRLQGELQTLTDRMQTESQQLQEQISAITAEKDSEIQRLRNSPRRHDEGLNRGPERFDSREPEKGALRQKSSRENPLQAPEPIPPKQLYDRPTDKDDLKKIKGIGKVLEKTLNQLGITTFAQIGRFTEEDIGRVSEALDVFPGRIARDDWVGRAKEAYLKKYGQSLE